MLIKSFIENLLLAVGGITVFLYGLKLMSENVQTLAGGKMKKLLSSATGSRVKGVAAGAAVTAVIQSSTATSIMLAGCVNTGVIDLVRVVPVIMGANIGTTVTAQLVSLSGSALFDVTAIGSLAAFAGFLATFSSRRAFSVAGGVTLGFGLIFIGLEIMNESVYSFGNYAFFRRMFTASNPFILMLNGFLITGIVQSASAVSSVMIVLAGSGVINFESSAYLILGTNIGAGMATLFVSASMGAEAKKVAIANVAFNVIGMMITIAPLMLFEKPTAAFFASLGGGIERQVANFHSLFNVAVTLVLLPFVKPFVKLVDKLCNAKLFRWKRAIKAA